MFKYNYFLTAGFIAPLDVIPVQTFKDLQLLGLIPEVLGYEHGNLL